MPVTLAALIAVQLACYVHAHRAIAAVKQREGWFDGLRQGVAADTSLRTDPARFPGSGRCPPYCSPSARRW